MLNLLISGSSPRWWFRFIVCSLQGLCQRDILWGQSLLAMQGKIYKYMAYNLSSVLLSNCISKVIFLNHKSPSLE